MGKKSRTKKRHSVKGRLVGPDDSFRHGPLEIVRIGKTIFMQNRMSEEDANSVQEKLVEHLPDVIKEINTTISQIAEKVSHFPPDQLLKRAYWEVAQHQLGTQSETDISQEGMISLRMIDYVQSVVASVPPAAPAQLEVSDQEWLSLRSLVESLFIKLNGEFFLCQAALRRKDPGFHPALEDFFSKTQMYWCNVRGHRYQAHNIPFLRDMLAPHDEVLKELYKIGVQELLDSLQRIQNSQIFGIGMIFDDIQAFRNDLVVELEKAGVSTNIDVANEPEPIVKQIIEKNGWSCRRDSIVARLSELDLHDVERLTTLPKPLLEDLSWSQGEDKEFFKEGQYSGWPLREWPVQKRPFLKLNGRYYCFDNYSLFDNIYRVIQRIIIAKKRGYSVSWNDRQQEVSERVPIELFRKLLPGVQVFNSVHYRWYSGSGGGKNWCEADALLVYEDHLIIVEVKGGAFTHTSPTTDFDAHFESLRNLVLKPAEQGRRFVSYIESDSSVKLYDRDHIEIGSISRRDFEHVTICAITLDPFTEIASRTQHFKKLGIDLGPYPVWSISIDDLRVYTEIFHNPLVFLHFIEERMKASKLDIVETEDELDHLGLYLKHNLYTLYIQGMNAKGLIRWHGYRADIDRFFSERLIEPTKQSSLQQKMPDRIEEIVVFLGDSSISGRRKLTSTLLNCSGDWRNKIARGIEEELARQATSKRPQSFSLHGELRITVFCWNGDLEGPDRQVAREQAQTVMVATNDPDRLFLLLRYRNGKLVHIEHEFLSFAAIPPDDLVRLKPLAESLIQKRLYKAQLLPGGIGRNQPCPCGNGKKYKKCHGS